MKLVFFKSKKPYGIGTIRTWRGIKYQKKTQKEWAPLKGQERKINKIKEKGKEVKEKILDNEALKMDKREKVKLEKQKETDKLIREVGDVAHNPIIQKFGIKRKGGKFAVTPVEEKKLGWALNDITNDRIKKIQRNIPKRNKFVKENQAFVTDTINNMVDRGVPLNREEARQDGNEGFIGAIQNFNPRMAPQGFLTYVRKYIEGYIMHKLRPDERAGVKEIVSLDTPITSGKDRGDKQMTLEDTIPGNETMMRDVEFRDLVNKMGKEIKHPVARRVFYHIALGFGQKDIVRMLDMPPSTVFKMVEKHVKPIVKKYRKYLVKSVKFNMVLSRIEDLLKSKQIYVKPSGKRKGYYRTDPRTKKKNVAKTIKDIDIQEAISEFASDIANKPQHLREKYANGSGYKKYAKIFDGLGDKDHDYAMEQVWNLVNDYK